VHRDANCDSDDAQFQRRIHGNVFLVGTCVGHVFIFDLAHAGVVCNPNERADHDSHVRLDVC